jgi:hypothetical protein
VSEEDFEELSKLLGIGSVDRFVAGLGDSLEDLEVRTRGEMTTGAGENNRSYGFVRLGPFESIHEGDHHRRRERIRPLWIIESEHGYRATSFLKHNFRHGYILTAPQETSHGATH